MGRFFAALLLAAVSAVALAQGAQKPNILFILVDNLGYRELGAYGGGATDVAAGEAGSSARFSRW